MKIKGKQEGTSALSSAYSHTWGIANIHLSRICTSLFSLIDVEENDIYDSFIQ
ncbi:MAG: hypothetical protein JRF02_07475 [Deltaproteobacteria bacterium]|jgi:hypothetical protein|nr:hypothetical protein [Deltaproteobacteria bacterium]